MAMQSAVARAPRPSGLADVLELILDKGLVIDAYVRISVVGIELITIDARIVIASVDTYLRFAEAVNRLDLVEQSDAMTLPDMIENLGGGSDSSESDDEPEAGEGESENQEQLTGEQSSEDSGEHEASEESTQDDDSSEGDTEGEDESGLLGRVRDRGKVYE